MFALLRYYDEKEWDLKYIYFTVQDVVKKEKPSDHVLQDGSKDQIESRGKREGSSSNQLSLSLSLPGGLLISGKRLGK